MAIRLTDELKHEYATLFDTCNIQPGKLAQVNSLAEKIAVNRGRYQAVGTPLNVPWFFIGLIHNMEFSLRFTGHLHNGDPLTARTTHVPRGRPPSGSPPFTWEESATDALRFQELDTVSDWSIPGVLFQLEKFNGFGYRTKHPEVLSPYLWSFSQHYVTGKYTEDGRFDPNATSRQCGAAVILRRLAEQQVIQFGPDKNENLSEPMVRYSEDVPSEAAKALQRALNDLPGIFLLVDGIAGRRTSDAFRKATGRFLLGDPRLKSAAARR